ncbi:Elongation of very long chain fatty acids protein 4 [Trichoplax sp. H2]|nr:Elongation of very long chain fatty acids protein 4 [Trichoplax sp. H2]|eukprot:RDD42867.1 Elongation of very long chain fatty acids protein 4 [Trichoplax sp. H2]
MAMEFLPTFAKNWYYSYCEYLQQSDPRVKNWPLMESLTPTLIISCLYLLVVYVGPKIMRSREALNLNRIMIIYNFCIVLLSFHMFRKVLMCAILANYSWTKCQSVVFSKDPNEFKMAEILWLYYFSKIIELLDTIFFILRKKESQITFLHVYHHASMMILWWLNVKWGAGGQAFFGPLCNSLIHVFMYLYYGLSALGPKYRKYTWWKKYMTTMQLTQFVIVIIHTILGLVYVGDCSYPTWMKWLLFFYMNSLLVLFMNFYRKAYQKKPKQQ